MLVHTAPRSMIKTGYHGISLPLDHISDVMEPALCTFLI